MYKVLLTFVVVGIASATTAAAADLTVSAAASLTNAFTEIGKAYEKTAPGVKVLMNFGSSDSLLQQIARGAPVDVFASADIQTMDRAQKQNLIVPDTRMDFVANKLVVVVPKGSGPVLKSVTDLSAAPVARIGIGIPESVPAGRYAKQALESARQWDALKSKYVFGQNVRQVLDYVARGEVDAAFVYATDAVLMKQKVQTAFDVATTTPILYPVAVVKESGNQKAARGFIGFVRSQAGQEILGKYGFLRP